MELTKIEQQRVLMERKGLTINKMSKLMGADFTTLYRYFAGKVTRKSTKGFYEAQIDSFLNCYVNRVNPESDGGGE